MNICCFLTPIHSGWLERVSTWKVTVIHSLESVGCLVLFGSSQLSKSNCQRSTWLPCASHMGYSVHTPNFWTSGDLVGTSALHVQLVRRTSQHWIVIWTLSICYMCMYIYFTLIIINQSQIANFQQLINFFLRPTVKSTNVYIVLYNVTKDVWNPLSAPKYLRHLMKSNHPKF